MNLRWKLKSLLLTVLATLVALSASADWRTAVWAYQQKDWDLAIGNLQELVEAHPDYAPAYNLLGLSLMAKDEDDAAEAPLKKAIELDPQEPNYSLALAQLLSKRKDAEGVFELLQSLDIEKLDSGTLGSYFKLYLPAAMHTQHASEAVVRLKGAAAKTSSPELYLRLGGVYRATKQPAEAFEAFSKAAGLDGNNPEPLRAGLKSGVAAAMSFDNERAQAYWAGAGTLGDRLCALEAGASNHELAGEAWLGAKAYQKALEHFKAALSEKPGDPLLHYYASLSLSGLERFGEALTEVKAALSPGADDADFLKRVYRQAAFVSDALQRYDEAIIFYQKLNDNKKIAEMQQKKKDWEQNKIAEEQCRKLLTQIRGLREQVHALEKLDATRSAKQVSNEANRLEAQYVLDCSE